MLLQVPQRMPEEEVVVETELEAVVAVAVEVSALGLGPELEIEPGPSVKPVGLAEIELRHLVDPASVAVWLEYQLQMAWILL